MIEIRTFSDYKPYRFDNGTQVDHPYYSYFGSEPPDLLVNPDTIIIHSMFVASDKTKGILESLDPTDCKNSLESQEYSTHFIIPRDEFTDQGKIIIYQMVETERKAWHAGKSRMPESDGRQAGLNHFSVGIELIGTYESGFTESQYKSLAGLIAILMANFPIENILGHNEVATSEVRSDPKTDPWNFDWILFASMLRDEIGDDIFNQLKLFDGMEK